MSPQDPVEPVVVAPVVSGPLEVFGLVVFWLPVVPLPLPAPLLAPLPLPPPPLVVVPVVVTPPGPLVVLLFAPPLVFGLVVFVLFVFCPVAESEPESSDFEESLEHANMAPPAATVAANASEAAPLSFKKASILSTATVVLLRSIAET